MPAYDGLLTALLDAKRVEEATEILKEVLGGDDVCPVELTFLPVLLELVKGREYDDATELMRQGYTRGVEFTSETFHPLLVLAEKDTTSTDSLIKFLQFVEDSWEEYKVRSLEGATWFLWCLRVTGWCACGRLLTTSTRRRTTWTTQRTLSVVCSGFVLERSETKRWSHRRGVATYSLQRPPATQYMAQRARKRAQTLSINYHCWSLLQNP